MLLWILRHLTRSLVSFSHHNLKKVITFELRRLPHKALWGHVTVTKRIAISRYWLYYTVSVGRCVGDDPWRNLDAKLKSKILFSLKMYRLIVEMIIHTTYQNQIVIYLTVAMIKKNSSLTATVFLRHFLRPARVWTDISPLYDAVIVWVLYQNLGCVM